MRGALDHRPRKGTRPSIRLLKYTASVAWSEIDFIDYDVHDCEAVDPPTTQSHELPP